jgi:dTDP-4-amino-4,6-dideoxygalactose transaminase
VGANSRLDELQAGLLRVRLSHMAELEAEKIKICERYLNEIHNDRIELPKVRERATHIWHQFVIRCESRDDLVEYLNKRNVGTIIHYPIPPHLSEAYACLGMKKGDLPVTERCADTVLSIPLYVGMTEDEQEYVIKCLNEY